VIMYASTRTKSIERAVKESLRRRARQLEYNAEHGITPESIRKSTEKVMLATEVADSKRRPGKETEEVFPINPDLSRADMIVALEDEMLKAANELEFERAASIRDRIFELRSESI
ncbi:MAG: excinuclease ABC subunit B, partial [Gemmatimonadetes bacterium]|nr:excinuclease ABC subunit B [Gemmatimonadota bacterium]